ncbi:hypothetical protein GCM10011348_00390 [Marinobacterium nitratireducens]|uniref:Aldehyde dehydrogenase domain-containing protein n=1 Tax=Marinobacterium nitratireducens TaxID=518897 RepID=A0A917Z5P6_9GAMM|nr:hypothetical protein GCM10011348_00390 [Marinobacterium nitratireducens]
MAPTILDGVTPDMRVARDEVFGPVPALQLPDGTRLCDSRLILDYLDFHLSAIDWRAICPRLAGWFATYSKRPSVLGTAPR